MSRGGSVATDPSSLIHLGYNDIESVGEDTTSFRGQQSQNTYSEAGETVDEESNYDKYQVDSTTTGPSIEESLSRNESKLTTQSDTTTGREEASRRCDGTTETCKDKISRSCDGSEGISYFTNLLTRKY